MAPFPHSYPSPFHLESEQADNMSSEFDPWRTSGMSSQFRPDGPLPSTPEHPLQIIPGGFHCSDLIMKNGAVNAGVQTVIDNEIAQIKTWVAEYYTK
jgi:hypothetical protein